MEVGGYVTRIAPSPTGDMHLGTVRTAYLNYLAARASGGKFILRIDDTDIARNRDEHTTVILKTMDWLGLEYDEIHYQSKRLDMYRGTAEAICKAGYARRLANGAIVLNGREELIPLAWHDEIAGDIAITRQNRNQIDGVVKVKDDKTGEVVARACHTVLIRGGDELGQPTYQFASVYDDILMGVNFVIRGTDHITNTAKQVAIWCALGEFGGERIPLPKFAHVGLICKKNKKLSKRAGDPEASVLWHRDRGVSPDAMLNFILRLGWGGKEIPDAPISKADAVAMFFKGKMRAAPANFDQAKLDYFTKLYAKRERVAA